MTCPNLTTGIPQKCLSCRFEVLANFVEVFALFLGAFIDDVEYFLCIMNIIKFSLMEHQIGIIFTRAVTKR